MRSHETNGKEYFFVSRETMENFIHKKKLIEFGEYKGCLYGTSKDSITRVMKTGKTCVLKVQPEVSWLSVPVKANLDKQAGFHETQELRGRVRLVIGSSIRMASVFPSYNQKTPLNEMKWNQMMK